MNTAKVEEINANQNLMNIAHEILELYPDLFLEINSEFSVSLTSENSGLEQGINLYLDSYRNKVTASGEYGLKSSDLYLLKDYDEKWPSVNVSPDRDAKKAAKSIVKRLLPLIKEKQEQAIQVVAKNKAYEEKESNAKETTFSGTSIKENGFLNLSNGYGKVSVQGGNVSLELSAISPEKANAILKLLEG